MAKKQYKVIALSVGGAGNKIYHSQDVVSEDGFVAENIQGLIDGGFIEEVAKEEKEPEQKGNGKPKK